MEADQFYDSITPVDLSADARNVLRQSCAGLLWSKQFYHYIVEDWLNGDPACPPPPEAAQAGPQSRMDAPLQCGRDFDAGQVGVSLVRGVGPGVPLRAAGADRFGVRQGSAGADAARVVHASQRAVAGVRMGVRRCQPAGACVGRVARLQDRKEAARRGRSRVSGARLPQTDAQLHLVGEPQGRRGAQHLRGRIPGAGQHRHLRPQQAATHRRLHGAGRRHGMDGACTA